MRCPFCKTRVSDNTDLCPQCGQRIEIKHNEKTKVKQIGVIVLLIFMLGLYFLYDLWRLSDLAAQRPENNNTFEKVLKNATGYIGEETVYQMIGYRDDLKKILTDQGYKNIKVSEKVQTIDFISAHISLELTASKDDVDIKIKYFYNRANGMVKSFAVAGSGYAKERQFEMKEEDVKELFDYLGFDDGYQQLKEGYKNMELSPDNNHYYILSGDYHLSLSNDIHGSIYKYSYMISR